MKVQIIAGAAAIAMALSMGIASAAVIGDGATPGYAKQRQELRHEPGYVDGTGAAQIGDGSSPGYQASQNALQHTPGFRFGEADAHVTPLAQ